MKIGIMGAMPQEIKNIRHLMRDIKIDKCINREFYCGTIAQHEVISVYSRCGKVASAITACSLINDYSIDCLIFTGVAGAASPTLNIGDIVIADQLYQHDMDARPIFPLHEIPLTGQQYFQTDDTLRGHAEEATQTFLSNITEYLSPSAIEQFSLSQAKYYTGTIATGDQFIRSTQQTQQILTEKPDALAVEMEGAAVAQVCFNYGIPLTVIRTISDRADHQAHIDFPKFIDDVASRYAEHIVARILEVV